MKKNQLIALGIMLLGAFCCTKPAEEEDKSEETISAIKGEYQLIGMIWEKEPEREFDFDKDGKTSTLYEELSALYGFGFEKLVVWTGPQGTIKNYKIYATIDYPIQDVSISEETAGTPVTHVGGVTQWPINIVGEVKKTGEINWAETVIKYTSGRGLGTILWGGKGSIKSYSPEIIEAEIDYKIYLPERDIFITGPVLLTFSKR